MLLDDDSDSAEVSPTARKSRAPVTPQGPGSPMLQDPPVRTGQRLSLQRHVGLSDYEFGDDTDGEVEAADGICAIKRPQDSPWGKTSPVRFIAPFKTPVPARKRSEDDEGLFFHATAPRPATRLPFSELKSSAVKRRLTDSGSSRGSLPRPGLKKQAVGAPTPTPYVSRMPQTPAEANRMLLHQTDSMKKLSLGDEDALFSGPAQPSSHIPKRRPRRISTTNAKLTTTAQPTTNSTLTRATANIFSSSTDTPTVPTFPHMSSPQPPRQRPNFKNARVQSTATLLFGGPKIPSPSDNAPMSDASVMEGQPPPIRVVPSSPSPHRGHGPDSDFQLDTFIKRISPLPSPTIPKKYRLRTGNSSGLEEDSDNENRDRLKPLKVLPITFTPTSHDDGLATPSFGPGATSKWPMLASRERRDVEKKIKENKARSPSPAKKPVPGTPVKRPSNAFARPWLSTSKPINAPATGKVKKTKAPRQSLPLSFPNLHALADPDDDDEEGSPSIRPLLSRRMRASVGGKLETVAMRRKSMREVLLTSSPSSSSSSSSEPITRAIPQRRRFSDSDSSDDDSTSASEMLGTPTKKPLFKPRPSAADVEFEDWEQPKRFQKNYMDTCELGRGEFGTVLRARRRADGTLCAIKRSKEFQGAHNRLRLREEAQVLKSLAARGGHGNVLHYVDSWEQDGQLFIETELCEYGNFARFLADYGSVRDRLDEARVWKVLADVAEGLRFVHDAGVIHLDLKPANILVGGDGRLRICDFGMASRWPRFEAGFEREGDREYMAPEVLQGVYGPAADVFSLGMVILETASNIIVPSMGEPWHKLREDDFSGVDLGSISDALVSLIRAMMGSAWEARPKMESVCAHPVVRRAREVMARRALSGSAETGMQASPLSSEPEGFLSELLRAGEAGAGAGGTTD